jgi:four helix bundle protein
LTDQIRRSSRSVGAQIAEAWAKRRYKKHFISKLTDADGEQLETQHWTDSAADCLLITSDQAKELLSKYEILGRKLFTMMDKADLFCSRD